MKTITIIEDERALLEMYTIKFKSAGYKVLTATNGIEGLKSLEAEQPDIVLLDLMMPEMSGDEMLVELRKKPWGKNLPVILLTNINYDEAPAILRSLNITDYILKANSTPHMILERVEGILAQ